MFPPPDRDGDATLEPRLAKVLEHQVRAQFLRLLAKHGRLSPPEALTHLDQDPKLANLVYNVWVLADLDLIEPDGEPAPKEASPTRSAPAARTQSQR